MACDGGKSDEVPKGVSEAKKTTNGQGQNPGTAHVYRSGRQGVISKGDCEGQPGRQEENQESVGAEGSRGFTEGE